jgi:hypothetical protein
LRRVGLPDCGLLLACKRQLSRWRDWPDPKRISWPVADGMAEAVYRNYRGSRIRNKDGSWRGARSSSSTWRCRRTRRSGQDEAVLRHVRLEDALEEAWSKVTIPSVTRNKRVSPPVWVFQELTEQDKRKTLRGLRFQNRRKITTSVHQKVAEIWLADTTDAPTKAVGDHFGLAPSTASLYVKRARDAGVLRTPPRRPKKTAPAHAPSSGDGAPQEPLGRPTTK